MQKLDRYSSTFWLVLSGYIVFQSYLLGIGSIQDPGPGFIFFYSGIFIGILAIIILVGTFAKAQEEPEADAFENVSWLKVLLPFTYILLYALILEGGGFIFSAFLIIFLFLKTIESKGWVTAIFAGAAVSLCTYAIFGVWLHVRLPKGFLGF